MKFKNDIEKFEFFESVLKNEISHDKRIDFENELKNNKQLAVEFEEHKIMSELVIDNSILDIKSDLVSIHNKFSGNSGVSSRKGKGFSTNNLISLILGGVILFSGIFLIVKSKKEGPTAEEVFINENKIEQAESVKRTEKRITQPEKNKQIQRETNEVTENKTESDSIKIREIAEEQKNDEKEQQTPVTLAEENKKITNNSVERIENPAQSPDVNLTEDKPVQEVSQNKDNEVIDCEKITITCAYKSKETCVENYSGEIIIDKKSFTGGTPPYTISINGGLDYYNSRYVFGSLKAGIYNLFVKDKNSCEKEIAFITIEEKICNTDYKYSPEFGELWTIPVDKNKKGIFRLLNKNGQILVEKDINEYSDNTWGGKDDNGVQLPMDYYPFVIQYSDGEMFKGSVTLVK